MVRDLKRPRCFPDSAVEAYSAVSGGSFRKGFKSRHGQLISVGNMAINDQRRASISPCMDNVCNWTKGRTRQPG